MSFIGRKKFIPHIKISGLNKVLFLMLCLCATAYETEKPEAATSNGSQHIN